jgi:cytochrome b6
MSEATREKIGKSRWLKWLDERFRMKHWVVEAMKKPVHPWARKWYYCLGGLTLVTFLVLVVTGLILLQHYRPTPEGAAESISYIMNDVWFGWLIRGIHHWAANVMMVLIVAHMIRVFLTGAYKKPRELNWIAGVLLLVTTVGFYISGFVLPWDQRGFEIATAIVGALKQIPLVGDFLAGIVTSVTPVGGEALGFFFDNHVIVLPLVILILLMFHFVMIRRQGIAEPL